jgi:hypothetical protein
VHRARSPNKLSGVEHQRRTGIGTVHDSCAQLRIRSAPRRTWTDLQGY